MTIQIEISDQDLPVLSVVATQALELLHHPNVTNQKIEELIRQDPSLTSRLLHIANSPFYATRMESKSIADAARKLGMRQLHNIILAAATGELFHADDAHAQQLWLHAQTVAMATQIMAETLALAHAEEAYIAGLLHDIGKIIIYRQHPELYASMLDEAQATLRPLHELESEAFKFFNHMSVGGLVVRKWRLSDTIAESARFHHDLLRVVPREMTNAPVACVVTLANYITNALFQAGPSPDPAGIEEFACSARLDLSRNRILTLLGLLQKALQPSTTPAPSA
jgi:putative nucleotidyltransferase with HDIG domain